jgi:hypothetical protein
MSKLPFFVLPFLYFLFCLFLFFSSHPPSTHCLIPLSIPGLPPASVSHLPRPATHRRPAARRRPALPRLRPPCRAGDPPRPPEPISSTGLPPRCLPRPCASHGEVVPAGGRISSPLLPPGRRDLPPPVPRHPPSFPSRSSSSARLRWALPGGEAGKGEAEPDEASVLWLRLAQTAPVSGFSGASPPEPSGARAFGRAPAGAGGGAGAGALPKRPCIL